MANRLLPINQYTYTIIEGQTGDIVINFPVAYSLIGKVVNWYYADSSGNIIKNKTTADGSITVTDQQAVIPLLTADTLGYTGSYKWHLWVTATGVNDPFGDGKLIVKSKV